MPFATEGHLVDGIQGSDVVPTGELIDIPLQVLLAHAVIGAVVTPLEHGPEGLNAVGVGRAFDVLPDTMTNGSMLEIHPDPIVAAMVVCVDGGPRLDPLLSKLAEIRSSTP